MKTAAKCKLYNKTMSFGQHGQERCKDAMILIYFIGSENGSSPVQVKDVH